MAYLKISLLMAKTLRYFDFKRAPRKPQRCRFGEGGSWGVRGGAGAGGAGGSGQPSFSSDIITSGHGGPYVMFNPQAGYCVELRK